MSESTIDQKTDLLNLRKDGKLIELLEYKQSKNNNDYKNKLSEELIVNKINEYLDKIKKLDLNSVIESRRRDIENNNIILNELFRFSRNMLDKFDEIGETDVIEYFEETILSFQIYNEKINDILDRLKHGLKKEITTKMVINIIYKTKKHFCN